MKFQQFTENLKSIFRSSLFFTIALSSSVFAQNPTSAACPEFLNNSFKVLHSEHTINLCELYKNKPIIIINTASHCGYTKQFKGLEALYKKYKAEGVELVGFTSNDFRQAAKSEKEAATVCYKNYGVTFTMIAPTKVRGAKANPVFAYLNQKSEKPSWNFNKYLISADGNTVKHYGSTITPLNSALEKDLQTLITSKDK